MRAPLYMNGDGSASGRFSGNPFIDVMARPDGDNIDVEFISVLKGTTMKSLKLEPKSNPRSGNVEYCADGEPWVVVPTKGKTKLAMVRRVMGGGAGDVNDAASLFAS